MALSRNEIQKRSDEKRGVKNKAFKMKLEDIALIEQMAQQTGRTQLDILVAALHEYRDKHGLA